MAVVPDPTRTLTGLPAGFPVGVELDADGAHPASWRVADHDPGRLFDPAHLRERFHRLDGGFAFLNLPDGVGRTPGAQDVRARLDTVETAAFAAAVTSRIALVPAVNTAHAEPFHLANQLSSLERGAQGRAGWLAGAVDDEATAATYGRAPAPGSEARQARDVVTTVRRLWDTWEDDVLLADTRTHRFFDLERWHHADVVTDSFSVKGPGLLPRPVQGQLPVWFEGVPSPELAPHIDVAVVSAPTTAGLARLVAQARAAGIPRVVASVEVVVDARGRTAQERLAELDAWTPWPVGDRLRLSGSPGDVEAGLVELSNLVDGLRLHPAVLDVDLGTLTQHLPAPRGGTLREVFDLPRPENVFALERSAR